MAGKNDIELLENTKEGRNINRHYYTLPEIDEEVKRPVVQALFNLLRFRNTAAAFDLAGEILVETPSEETIIITRKDSQENRAVLTANLQTKDFEVKHNGEVVLTQLAE